MIDWNKVKTSEQKEVERLQKEIDRVRSKRNGLLKESDWTQLSDAPVSHQAWSDYRQALRDIPEQSGFPSNVIWPEKPTQS